MHLGTLALRFCWRVLRHWYCTWQRRRPWSRKQRWLLVLCLALCINCCLQLTCNYKSFCNSTRPPWPGHESRRTRRLRARRRRSLLAKQNKRERLIRDILLELQNGSIPDRVYWHPTRGIRIGEAGNPGPRRSIALSSLIRPAKPAQDTARIHSHTGQAVKPGIDRDPKQLASYSLRVCTANSTAWGPLQQFLLTCSDDVVMAQEHHLTQEQLAQATQWALRHGWQPTWGAATVCPETGGTSGGVAVFVREGIGTRHGHHVLEPTSRMCAAIVNVPGGSETLMVSTYLQCTVGLSDGNIDALHSIGVTLTTWSKSFIVGGDFNMEPTALEASGITGRANATLVVPNAPRGTCTIAEQGSLIDYFLVDNQLVTGLADVRVNYMSGLAPHRPVSLGFHPRLASICAQYLQKPDPMDTQRQIGPLWQSPKWDLLLTLVRSVRDKAKSGANRESARRELATLLPRVADAVEDELVRASGTPLPARRKRCRGIDAKWKPVLKYKQQLALNSAATRWALQASRDLQGTPSVNVQQNWGTVLNGSLQAQQTASDLASSYLIHRIVHMHSRLTDDRGQWNPTSHQQLKAELESLVQEATTMHTDICAAETAFARRS